MSRFYRLVIGPQTAAGPARIANGAPAPPSDNAGAVWTNLVNGKADLGAQTIEFDLPVGQFDTPLGGSYVRIWGPSKQQIGQASDFNGAPISIYGGMQKGLPLASAAASQAGLLVKGMIFQAFGNWQGINQSLDFVIITDGGATQSMPANLSFTWNQGQKLGDAITQTLQTAYAAKGYKVVVNISPNLVPAQTDHGVYQTIEQFSTYLKGVSQDIMGGDYQGVGITLKDDIFTVTDGTNTDAADAIQIIEQDLIGQVTWLDAATISFSTVLRSDISVQSQIKLPALAGLQAVTNANSASNARAKNTFQGTWTVKLVRHVGNSRAPDAQSWITNFQAFTNTVSPAASSVADSSA